jgi:hypothetical protein
MSEYDELRLRIDAGGTASYRVLASTRCAEASGSFEPPFTELDIDHFMLRTGSPRGRRSIEIPSLEAAKRFGGALFNAVFRDEVGDLYHGALGAARSTSRGLRITLCLSGSPELMQVPWELLFDAPNFLAISAFTPVVRYLDLPRAPRPLLVEPPLRILGVVSNPADYERLDVDGERANLELALARSVESGALELQWLERPTLDALLQTLRAEAFHGLHYIGHGRYDRQSEQGVLLFEDCSGWGRPISGDELATVLHDITSLRLAVLNACEGARTARSDPFAGMAEALVQRDIPAVIAMQSEISDEAAMVFAEGLYSAIVAGSPVDSAVSAARMSMFAKRSDDVEWGTPALFMRVPDGRIFQLPDSQASSSQTPDDSDATPTPPGGRLTRGPEPPRLLSPAATATVPAKRLAQSTANAAEASEPQAAPGSRGPRRRLWLLLTAVGSAVVLTAAFASIVAPGASSQTDYAAEVSKLCNLADAQQHALTGSARTLRRELISASSWQQQQQYVLQATDSRITDAANLLAVVDSLEPSTAAAASWRDMTVKSIKTTLTGLDDYQLNLQGVKGENQLVTRVAAFDHNRKQFVANSVTTRAALTHVGGPNCLAPDPAMPVVGIGPTPKRVNSAADVAPRQRSQTNKHSPLSEPRGSTAAHDQPDLVLGAGPGGGAASSTGVAPGDAPSSHASPSSNPGGGRSSHRGASLADGWTRWAAIRPSSGAGGASSHASPPPASGQSPDPTRPPASGQSPDAIPPPFPRSPPVTSPST